MADLHKLLSESAEDLKETLLPIGTWKGAAVSGKLTDPKFSEKMEKEFVQALIVLRPEEPQDDVDANEVRALNGEEKDVTLFYRKGPLHRAGDFAGLRNLLEGAFGISPTGRTIPEMLKEIDGQVVLFEVAHEDYEGETRNVVKKVYAPE